MSCSTARTVMPSRVQRRAASRRSRRSPRATCRRSARRAAAALGSTPIAMPISSHCFWPCDRAAGRPARPPGRGRRSRGAGRSSRRSRWPCRWCWKRDLEVLPHRQRREDARHLELDADAAADALGTACRPVMSSPGRGSRPLSGGCSPRISRKKRALAGAVRPDQAVDLAGLRAAKSMSRATWTPPKRLLRPRVSRSGVMRGSSADSALGAAGAMP